MRVVGVAWITIAAVIGLIATNVSLPLDFLVRPLVVAIAPAALIGIATFGLGRFRILAAVVLGILVVIPALWPWAVGIVLIESAMSLLGPRLRISTMPIGRFALASALILLAVSVIRLAPGLLDYVNAPAGDAPAESPPVYLVLMDGYPRLDSLADLGIDNAPFIAALRERGFDYYADATSLHRWTHRSLQALMAGSPDGIPDTDGSTHERERIRSSLELPAGFVTIDAPVAHATLRGGRHVSAGGVNDFEAHLIGSSVLGSLGRDWAADFIGHSLRLHFEDSLELLGAIEGPRVFAHLLAPHSPFLYAGGISACWPGCRIFAFSAEELELSLDEWTDQMRQHLPEVNERVLATVDSVLARHPDAVIVLFSDHGARYGSGEETYRSFLAALTPGHPNLYETEAHPHAVLRRVNEAYP